MIRSARPYVLAFTVLSDTDMAATPYPKHPQRAFRKLPGFRKDKKCALDMVGDNDGKRARRGAVDGSGDVSIDRGTRRWNRARAVFALFTLAGFVFCIASALGNFPTWAWIAGFAATFLSGCLLRISWDKHRAALFAGAPTAVGTVLDVLESQYGDGASKYHLLIDAELAHGVTIRRRIDIGGGPDPLGWVEKPVEFRHRTLDPDDLDDAFFGREERRATLGPGA
ncbi:hypothetical protein ACWDTP_10635 [Mycobacterium sp. NPDC003449]